jgi:hypothetical protein
MKTGRLALVGWSDSASGHPAARSSAGTRLHARSQPRFTTITRVTPPRQFIRLLVTSCTPRSRLLRRASAAIAQPVVSEFATLARLAFT